MVQVEGDKIKGKRLPKKQLLDAWKTLSNKPFPRVKAIKLSNGDFDQVLEHRYCSEDCLREIEEWGRILSTRGTDACVFNADNTEDADYVILVRKNPYHSLEKIILHELSHIARGDL